VDGNLETLPGTRREAEDCRRLPEHFRWLKVRRHLANEASEQTLSHCQSPFVLHIGAHGLFLYDAASPLNRSALALSGANKTLGLWNHGKSPPPESDGIVMASEIAQLNLANTWMVVLSACDTGIGSAVESEGVVGLQSAFAQAGARNVLFSLWRIEDDYAPGFLKQFYIEALKSTNAVSALHLVQNRALTAETKEKSLWRRVKTAGPFVIYTHR
jgi:CHAT domain-containing protein